MLRRSASDCYAIGEQVAAQNGGTLAKAAPSTQGGQPVCVIVVLVPGKDGTAPAPRATCGSAELTFRRCFPGSGFGLYLQSIGKLECDSMRILVVEDDKDLNRQLSDALADAGYVGRSCFRRRGRAFSRRHRALRRRRARHRPAADGRHQRGRALAPCRPQDAGPDSDGARSLERQGLPASMPAPTTMSPSPSTSRKFWRASAR